MKPMIATASGLLRPRCERIALTACSQISAVKRTEARHDRFQCPRCSRSHRGAHPCRLVRRNFRSRNCWPPRSRVGIGGSRPTLRLSWKASSRRRSTPCPKSGDCSRSRAIGNCGRGCKVEIGDATGDAAVRALAIAMRAFAHERPGLSAATFRNAMTDLPEWRREGELLAAVALAGVRKRRSEPRPGR